MGNDMILPDQTILCLTNRLAPFSSFFLQTIMIQSIRSDSAVELVSLLSNLDASKLESSLKLTHYVIQ